MSGVVMEVLDFYPITMVVECHLPWIQVDAYPFVCEPSSLDKTAHDQSQHSMDQFYF